MIHTRPRLDLSERLHELHQALGRSPTVPELAELWQKIWHRGKDGSFTALRVPSLYFKLLRLLEGGTLAPFTAFCNDVRNNPNISNAEEAELIAYVEAMCATSCP